MPVYLADSSVLIASRRQAESSLRGRVAARFEAGVLATCVPVALEVLVGPRSAREYEEDWTAFWSRLTWIPLTEKAAWRALEVQHGLVQVTAGRHRRSAVDYLVAACAEEAGPETILWHWDADLTAICEHTGQPHEPEHERARQHGLD